MADTPLLLNARDTLQSIGATWAKDAAGRSAMTLACHDADYLPRVKGAGTTKTVKGVPVQIMHNGLYVERNGYQGQWMTDIIKGLKGVHEPQEEKVFYEVLKRVKSGGTMIELGSWWCYYSMWFLKSTKGPRKAICCEPDPKNIKLGKSNMELNDFKIGEDAIFYDAATGSKDKQKISFKNEYDTQVNAINRTVDSIVKEQTIKDLEILHIDIQGSELHALQGALQSIKAGIVRFVFISTHHYTISGDPNIHNKCLKFIKDHGGTIVAQHTIFESCSGDGLIVASFHTTDKDFRVQISAQHGGDSLFRTSEEDVDILWKEHNKLVKYAQELAVRDEKLKKQLANLRQELNTREQYILRLKDKLGWIASLHRRLRTTTGKQHGKKAG
jgi:FkbM family methyltransferase